MSGRNFVVTHERPSRSSARRFAGAASSYEVQVAQDGLKFIPPTGLVPVASWSSHYLMGSSEETNEPLGQAQWGLKRQSLRVLKVLTTRNQESKQSDSTCVVA